MTIEYYLTHFRICHSLFHGGDVPNMSVFICSLRNVNLKRQIAAVSDKINLLSYYCVAIVEMNGFRFQFLMKTFARIFVKGWLVNNCRHLRAVA